MKLPELGVKRPVATAMAFIAILILGVVSLTMLALDLMPEIEPPSISVLTPWLGASTEDVETKVTRVVENDLSIVNNLDELRSTTKEGLSVVTCKFNWGTNLDEAANDIRDRLEFAKLKLPDDIDQPIIFKFNTSMFPIMFYGIAANESWERLYDLIDDEVSVPLKRLPGVGAVQIWGGLQREIYVKLDRAKLAAYGLTLRDVEEVLRAENLTLPAGTIKIGGIEYTIRVPGEYENPRQIRDVVLKRSNGAIVYLRDVAEVADTFREEKRPVEMDGRPALQLAIQKQSGANTVGVAKAVKAEMRRLEENLPRDVKVSMLMDSSQFITRSIDNVSRAVMWGGLFVALITFVFLRNFRTSLIIVLTIPFSMIIAFTFMFMMGWTLNVMSMAALAIAIGMVVDNAVVILENITSHVERGERIREAAMFGSEEVGLAISASTLTTVVVFVPLIFVSGIAGIMFKQLGGIISITLLASLLCALMLTPMLCSRLMQPMSKVIRRSGWWSRFYDLSERGFDWLEDNYSRLLGWSLRHRPVVWLVAMAALAGSIVLIPLIGTEFAPEEDMGDLRITVELPVGTKVEETAKVCRRIEAVARRMAGERAVEHHYWRCGETESGIGVAFGSKEGSHIGTVALKLVPQTERTRSSKQVGRQIVDAVRSWPEIIKISLSAGNPMSDILMGGGKPVSIEILGHDIAATNELAKRVQEIVRRTAGAEDVTISRDAGRPELTIRVNRQKAASLGLNITNVSESLRTLFYGREASRFREAENEYDILIRLKPDQRRSIEDIRSVEIVAPGGRRIPLDGIASVDETQGPVEIERKNQERMVKVEFDTHGRTLGEVVSDVRRKIGSGVVMPPGVSIQYAGMVKEQQESFGALFMMLILGVLLVYMVMAGQFESFLDPFIIMFSVPFAFTGVALALAITKTSLSIMSLIGIILLIGTVVNNAIVLIDYANILRARGLPMMEAVQNAGRQRLRPVLITTLTTIFGMLPLSISRGEGSEIWRPLGITVIGGLAVSTLVTLVLVPTVYSLFEGRRTKIR